MTQHTTHRHVRVTRRSDNATLHYEVRAYPETEDSPATITMTARAEDAASCSVFLTCMRSEKLGFPSIEAASEHLDACVAAQLDRICGCEIHEEPITPPPSGGNGGPSLDPTPQADQLPDSVRSNLVRALNTLQGAAVEIQRARALEARFGCTGRYQADVLLNNEKALAQARSTVRRFMCIAGNKGLDAQAILNELGGAPDTTPSAEARAWMDSFDGAPIDVRYAH